MSKPQACYLAAAPKSSGEEPRKELSPADRPCVVAVALVLLLTSTSSGDYEGHPNGTGTGSRMA